MSSISRFIDQFQIGVGDGKPGTNTEEHILELFLKVYNAEESTHAVDTLEANARKLLDLLGVTAQQHPHRILFENVIIPATVASPDVTTPPGTWESLQDGTYRGLLKVAKLLNTCFAATIAVGKHHDVLSEVVASKGLALAFCQSPAS